MNLGNSEGLSQPKGPLIGLSNLDDIIFIVAGLFPPTMRGLWHPIHSDSFKN